MTGCIVVETDLGFMALAWSDQGLTRLSLPEPTREGSARHMLKWAVTPVLGDEDGLPPFVADAVALVRRYASGETVDFRILTLDLDGVDLFRRAIYTAALRLAQGETTTYGELAEQAGFPKMARETGQALGRNPLPLVIPCHRILAAGGKIGGFSAPGGATTKERMLRHEGVALSPPSPAQASFSF